MEINSANFFEIFSLPESFQIDEQLLAQRYKTLQSNFHPDKFVNAEDDEKARAVRLASLLNDAYETLQQPLKRASYLLSLRGLDGEEHRQDQLDEDFLTRQLELRERVESYAREESLDDLEKLKKEVESERQSRFAEFESRYEKGDYEAAKPIYNKLQFLDKLAREIEAVEEKLLDY